MKRYVLNFSAKHCIKSLLPPFVVSLYKTLPPLYGYSGDYSGWEAASKKCSGYDSDIILKKVQQSLLKVKNGEAVYERDSVLFDEIQYSWPLLASLMWIAAQKDGELSIIDFGGSLGSTYYQNRRFLSTLKRIKWNIVEQKHFVETGKKLFEDEELKFYRSIEACLEEQKIHAILLSSVVQYMKAPYAFLKEIINHNFEYVIFDRTSFMKHGKDRITVQTVPPSIYSASYPCWFLDEQKFLDLFSAHYDIVERFDALAGEIFIDNKTRGFDKGFIMKRKEQA